MIEDIGTIVDLPARGNYRLLTIKSPLVDSDLSIGDSIACDGVCLTVTELGAGSFTVEASQETAERSILHIYRRGSLLNLERALQVGSRVGGHFVTGHVDCTASVAKVVRVGESLEIVVQYDPKFDRLVIEKGSVAINGISLTVNRVDSGRLSVNLIPHSATATTVSQWKTGDEVNIEFDMLGKYLLKINQYSENNGLTKNKLFESGW
ncbi:MAG: riboflavin synthase [candidate division Zixibacteria bacterium]|nr:riboflavin synthase [candidate division Zixibacteria bacterium]